MSERETGYQLPILRRVKHGWAAAGEGWAVHGATREEALQAYDAAEATHHEIDQRPFRFEDQTRAIP